MKRRITSAFVAAFVFTFVAMPVWGQFGTAYSAPKIAYFDLRGPVVERPVDEMMTLFGGSVPPTLKQLVERFQQARDDDEIKAVVMTLEGVQLGWAQMEELRHAIAQVRAADKEVYVHADSLNLITYLLASSASEVSVVPTGELWLLGLYGETPYLKGLLTKIGVQADFLQMGAYKSGAEPLLREGPSPESEEMTNWLLDSLYDSALGMIAESRQMSKSKVSDLIDAGPYLAKEALEAGLINSVQYRQDFADGLKKRYGSQTKFVKNYGSGKGSSFGFDPASDPFTMIKNLTSLFTDVLAGDASETAAASIGIVYVEGLISTGREESNPFGGSSGAKSTSIRKALDEAANDNSIKAVVLRVDSPGGSALASEIIWNATQRVKAKKPLVVSMGNVAGSGGYYVACGADAIFADAMTITASIGVIGGKLVTTEMWNKLGVNWSPHQRGKNAALMNTSRPFNEYERGRIHKYMDDVYTVFKNHVVDGRGKALTKPIDQMAGGRVYTGEQARDLGLIDQIGGLHQAIRHAAKLASIGEYETRILPAPKGILELLMEGFGGGSGSEDEDTIRLGVSQSVGFGPWSSGLGQTLFDPTSPFAERAGDLFPLLQRLDPQRVNAIMQVLMTLDLIERDGVALMMEPIVIRSMP